MALDNGQIQLDVQAGIALSIPNRYASATVFTKVQLSALVMSDINPDDLKDENWNNDEYKMQSTAEGLAGGTADLGIAIAKSFDLPFREQKYLLAFLLKFKKSML
ncbi:MULTISPECIES: conjugal transfer protein TraF [unclassified Photobacterium]|uniref:conjugal transfer protein TraF n=1 Tax=unclassified Photobacterium TaxID=2628852 RepID=UPI002102550E|nr:MULTISPECIES: conjugal transfer protein TraF [unclassified Photobacterium]MCG3864995.1 conjugal transfer protein TraF [Photobacterium sp. Ph6]MCG3876403.1 conjugal transfer protein TraF [Photobacterium sp. Ph5]